VGKNNTYGHPAAETLTKFKERGIAVLKTSDVGNIELVFDGTKYWQQ
jgi:beta-lactamase superfamily II metal-dependent hydrolase